MYFVINTVLHLVEQNTVPDLGFGGTIGKLKTELQSLTVFPSHVKGNMLKIKLHIILY